MEHLIHNPFLKHIRNESCTPVVGCSLFLQELASVIAIGASACAHYDLLDNLVVSLGVYMHSQDLCQVFGFIYLKPCRAQ